MANTFYAGVYLSLNGVIIPNHGYVVMSDIGSAGDDTALICHTNRPPPDNLLILEEIGLHQMRPEVMLMMFQD